MAYIELNNAPPGITGLLENHPDTGAPIRELTQILLRGESTLTELERELIAALFCLYNRNVDGLGTYRPEDPAYYQRLAARLVTIGYSRPKEGIRNGEESFK